MIRVARQFSLARLEDRAYECAARNLEWLVEDEEFRALVLEDASGVRAREETDSIDVIDSVRYHLTAASVLEAHERLAIIDELLEQLGLDG